MFSCFCTAQRPLHNLNLYYIFKSTGKLHHNKTVFYIQLLLSARSSTLSSLHWLGPNPPRPPLKSPRAPIIQHNGNCKIWTEFTAYQLHCLHMHILVLSTKSKETSSTNIIKKGHKHSQVTYSNRFEVKNWKCYPLLSNASSSHWRYGEKKLGPWSYFLSPSYSDTNPNL